MKINLYVNRAEVSSDKLEENYIGVAIDVLRATTTMVTAFAHGCRAIIPVTKVADALQLAKKFDVNEVLLCGERNERAIEGFDLSNSPREYKRSVVEDKTLIMTTTNGAQLFSITDANIEVAVCSFLNINAIANYLLDQKREVAILCAGKYGEFGLEDVVCGGMLVGEILKKDRNQQLNDGAIAALKLYNTYENDIFSMLIEANHGKRLIEIGLMEDLKFASQVNCFDILPIWKNKIIQI